MYGDGACHAARLLVFLQRDLVRRDVVKDMQRVKGDSTWQLLTACAIRLKIALRLMLVLRGQGVREVADIANQQFPRPKKRPYLACHHN